ncbi:hypothetical protein [Petroclostridium sp. X23]|uniref:hypothetical protein n=1 Tax=Petroclostridium sp. X23 TaxID=3045146 RepID=UPI0024AD7287|nr:hypothetical protein [Petroclostridium sp. X23]WHH57493.1 hypothetical protein QKW49_16870 [Petroclostridium sp. X23]
MKRLAIKTALNKGRKEGREEVAKNLLSMGMTVEMVAQATKLSAERVKTLMSGN